MPGQVDQELSADPSGGFDALAKHLRAAGEEVLGCAAATQTSWREGHEEALRQLAQARQTAYESTPLAWVPRCGPSLTGCRAAEQLSDV